MRKEVVFVGDGASVQTAVQKWMIDNWNAKIKKSAALFEGIDTVRVKITYTETAVQQQA